MTALLELMAADQFGDLGEPGSLTALACPHGIPLGWHCSVCAAEGEGSSSPDDVLLPLPDSVSTELMSWRRVVAWVVTVAVLLVWALAMAGLCLEQWRAEA